MGFLGRADVQPRVRHATMILLRERMGLNEQCPSSLSNPSSLFHHRQMISRKVNHIGYQAFMVTKEESKHGNRHHVIGKAQFVSIEDLEGFKRDTLLRRPSLLHYRLAVLYWRTVRASYGLYLHSQLGKMQRERPYPRAIYRKQQPSREDYDPFSNES